ncbi:MAG: RnfABCDGE type electron transport complex subunit B [Treponema sp.]|nr:RnfABCDGE type electron transport complex subunit B [Treponema sp.]
MNVIIIAVISVTAIGIICAVILNVASKLMYVKIDERIAQLSEILPGINCGVCGYPGCSAYADALISGENVKPNLCTPGGVEALAKISSILGIEAGTIEQKIAVVSCSGDRISRQKKMAYSGIQTCEAASPLFGGENACSFGCLGYGDCQRVCPNGAICMESGLARISPHLCIGCALCVKTCPHKLISVEKKDDFPIIVACKNTEKGAIVRKKCTNGCIACTKCLKVCPDEAIVIENNLAKISYTKCSGCKKCAEVCVAKCIEVV